MTCWNFSLSFDSTETHLNNWCGLLARLMSTWWPGVRSLPRLTSVVLSKSRFIVSGRLTESKYLPEALLAAIKRRENVSSAVLASPQQAQKFHSHELAASSSDTTSSDLFALLLLGGKSLWAYHRLTPMNNSKARLRKSLAWDFCLWAFCLRSMNLRTIFILCLPYSWPFLEFDGQFISPSPKQEKLLFDSAESFFQLLRV